MSADDAPHKHMSQAEIDKKWAELTANHDQDMTEAIETLMAERDNYATRLAWLFGTVLSVATFCVLLVIWAVATPATWHTTAGVVVAGVVALLFSFIAPSSTQRMVAKLRRSRDR